MQTFYLKKRLVPDERTEDDDVAVAVEEEQEEKKRVSDPLCTMHRATVESLLRG